MQETDLHYPPQTCPFCTIAAAFPFPSSPSTSSSPDSPPPTPSLWKSSSTQEKELLKESIPKEEESDPEKTNPSSFVVLRSKDVVAFLDILPMTGGHLLVTTRQHKVKVADMEAVESKEIEIKNKSWTMFGRGQRDDLDDEEGAKMAGEMRRVLREEVEKMGTASAKL
ncbi:hypothetical protein J4E91_007373 [Alternaria rosae]|nr:hypothetical protein J4E91_007373 [Alternaria rosae]